MRANTVMPFAFTAASSLFIVSAGPEPLNIVVNPSGAAITRSHGHIGVVTGR
jgi:hypothetical protein